jgi:hypothetical protein
MEFKPVIKWVPIAAGLASLFLARPYGSVLTRQAALLCAVSGLGGTLFLIWLFSPRRKTRRSPA